MKSKIILVIVLLTAAGMSFGSYFYLKNAASKYEEVTGKKDKTVKPSREEKTAVKKLQPVNLASLAGKDCVIYIGARNCEKALKSIYNSNLSEVVKKLDLEKYAKINTAQFEMIQRHLKNFCSDACIGVEDKLTGLLSNNILVSFYGNKSGDTYDLSYAVIMQPGTDEELGRIRSNIETNSFPITENDLSCFISNGAFFGFAGSVIVITKDFNVLKAVLKEAGSQQLVAAQDNDMAGKALDAIYADDKDPHIYLNIPVERFIESVSGTIINMGRGEMREAPIEQVFWYAELSDTIDSRFLVKIVRSDNEYVNKMLDIKPKKCDMLKFVPKDAVMFVMQTSFDSVSWFDNLMSQKTGINAAADAARTQILARMNQALNIDFRKDFIPLMAGEIGFIVNDISLSKKTDGTLGSVDLSLAYINKSDNADKLVDFVNKVVNNINDDFKKEIKLFDDEIVPDVFTMVKVNREKLASGETVFGFDLGENAQFDMLKGNVIQYASIGGYFILGCNIGSLIDTYYKRSGSIYENSDFMNLAEMTGGIDEIGTINYFNSQKTDEIISRVVGLWHPGVLKKMEYDGKDAVSADNIEVHFMGWLGDILSKAYRENDWLVSKCVFSVHDLSVEDWSDIFKVMAIPFKQDPKNTVN